nr:MAG TPA: hypothetical protein [Caudoviricetes sp.]
MQTVTLLPRQKKALCLLIFSEGGYSKNVINNDCYCNPVTKN